MYGPKVSMERRLSSRSSGVPVNPISIAPGSSAFIASCSLPDWVRWHSSTKTKISPLRSEEHTSELQSHSDLVCRLLLEKKKINRIEFCQSNHLCNHSFCEFDIWRLVH